MQSGFLPNHSTNDQKNMKSTVAILTTPTVDTAGSSVLLTFDDKKYLFGNVHEGLQRVCIQNGTRLIKVNNIFLTGKTEWRTTGGLMGFILTIADVVQGAMESTKEVIYEAQNRWLHKLDAVQDEDEREQMLMGPQPKDKLQGLEVSRLSIHGGGNIMQLLATARRFIFRKGLPLDVHELEDSVSTAQPTWEDSNIQVWAMPLRPQNDALGNDAQSTRKRSFDEYDEIPLDIRSGTDNSLDGRKQQLKAVISDMFDSDWRFDTLHETPLSEVELPAAMFIRDPDTGKLGTYQGPMPGNGEDVSNVKVLIRKPWPGALVHNLPETQPSTVSMSYIVKTQSRRGKFNPAIAKNLGIKPGPVFRKLAEGESVENDKGHLITPDQVCGAQRDGRGFAVIEVPTAGYISSLKNMSAFQNPEIMHGVETIFWLAGPGITIDPEFQALVQATPLQKHVISSPDHCANYLTIDSAAEAQLKHRQIDKERFSIPIHNNVSTPLPSELANCIIATRGICVTLEPELNISTVMEPGLLNTVDVVQKMFTKAKTLSNDAQQEIQSPDFQKKYENQSLPVGDAEIITLGTGSASPSKLRNVSATLIRVPNIGSYLLDVGENTIGQLSRIYTPEQLKGVLRDLKLIWISHMHADHHLGLTSVIKAWHTAVYGESEASRERSPSLLDQMANPAKYLGHQKKLCVVSEEAMLHWLQEYSEVEEFGYEKVLPLRVHTAIIENGEVSRPTKLEWHRQFVGFHKSNPGVIAAMRQVTGLSDLQAVYVSHCREARAVAMTWPNGLKISYSGDCRPSRNFAAIGGNSTVLIHEATFDDALAGDAKAKKHSTTREAIGVGIRMKAKRIILTHFSQRYSKLPEMSNVTARPIDFEDPDIKSSVSIERLDETEGVPAATKVEALEAKSVMERNISVPTNSLSITRHGPDVDVVDSEVVKNIRIGVAFDSMRVKVKDIILLDNFKAAFQKLYGDPEAVDPEKLARKAEGEAANQRRLEEKKARQEQHRHQQIGASKLKRKTSKASSLNADRAMSARNGPPVRDSMENITQEHEARNIQ